MLSDNLSFNLRFWRQDRWFGSGRGARRFADASGAACGLFVCWVCSEETPGTELSCLSRSTRLPAVLGGLQTLPRVPGCLVPQSATVAAPLPNRLPRAGGL